MIICQHVCVCTDNIPCVEPQTTPAPPSQRQKPRGGVWIAVIVVALLAYAGSLFAYWFLSASSQDLPPANLDNKSESVVVINVQSLKTADRKVEVKVSVFPEQRLMDEKLDVLKEDISVRLYPWNTSGDLRFKAGESPNEASTTLDLNGDSDQWPFDTYRTEQISADVLVGSGEEREFSRARVEFEASIDGWNVSTEQGPPSPDSTEKGGSVQLIFSRALGPLAFDLGICLVLIALPTLAVFTAVQVATRRREYHPPFITWYAAMLFAIVPLRNLLPGAPPPGAWIDMVLVLWVLIALVSAMVVYTISWYKLNK
jgi:hypothetical protein